MSTTLATLPEIDRVSVEPETLRSFRREDEFVGLGVSLMVEIASYACLAAGTTGLEPNWDRDRAAVGGNMVRLYKLTDSLLDQTAKRRMEMVYILARLIFETAVTVEFLIKNFSSDLIDSYVRHSFRHERRLRDRIQKNISARKGIVLPIEDRMLKSIERSANIAKISLDDIDLSDNRPWGGKTVFDRAKDVDLATVYSAAFSGVSHNVHGNWHDIYGHHLSFDEKSGRFSPDLTWSRPRPQLLSSMAMIVARVVDKYFEFMTSPDTAKHIRGRLADFESRVKTFVRGHEGYLGGKTWPQI